MEEGRCATGGGWRLGPQLAGKGQGQWVALGPGAHKVLFEPYKCLWWVWGLFLNVISLFLPSCWGFSFALGWWVFFW